MGAISVGFVEPFFASFTPSSSERSFILHHAVALGTVAIIVFALQSTSFYWRDRYGYVLIMSSDTDRRSKALVASSVSGKDFSQTLTIVHSLGQYLDSAFGSMLVSISDRRNVWDIIKRFSATFIETACISFLAGLVIVSCMLSGD